MSLGKKPKHRAGTSLSDVSTHDFSGPQSRGVTEDELKKKKRKLSDLNVMSMSSSDAEVTPKRAKYEPHGDTEPVQPVPKRKKKGNSHIEEQTDQEISRKKKKKQKEDAHREAEDTRADERSKKSHKAKESKICCRDEGAADSKIADLDGRSRMKKKKEKKDRPLEDSLVEESLTVNKKKRTKRKHGGEETTENVNQSEDWAEDGSVEESLISETKHSSKKKKKKKRKDDGGLQEGGFTKEPFMQRKYPSGSETFDQVEDLDQEEKPVKKKKRKVDHNHREADDITVDASSSFAGLRREEPLCSEIIDLEDRSSRKKKKKSKDRGNHSIESLGEELMNTDTTDPKKKTKWKDGGYENQRQHEQEGESVDQAGGHHKKEKTQKKAHEEHLLHDRSMADSSTSDTQHTKKKTKRKDGGDGSHSQDEQQGEGVDQAEEHRTKKKKRKKDLEESVEDSSTDAQHSKKKTKKKDGGDGSQRQHEQAGEGVDQAEEHRKKKKKQKKDLEEREGVDQAEEHRKKKKKQKKDLEEQEGVDQAEEHRKKKKKQKKDLEEREGVDQAEGHGKKKQKKDLEEQEGVDQAEGHGNKNKKQKKDLEEREVMDQAEGHGKKKKKQKKDLEEQEGVDQAEGHGKKKNKQKKDCREPHQETALAADDVSSFLGLHHEEPICGELTDTEGTSEKKKKKSKKHHRGHLLEDCSVEESWTLGVQHTSEKKANLKDGGHKTHRHHGFSKDLGTRSKQQDSSEKKEQLGETEDITEKPVKKKKKKKHKGERYQEADDPAADEASSIIGLRGEEPARSEDTSAPIKKKKSNNPDRRRLLENGLVEEDTEQSHRHPSSASTDAEQHPATRDERRTTQDVGETRPPTLRAKRIKNGSRSKEDILTGIRPQDIAMIQEYLPRLKDANIIRLICCHELERFKAARKEGITFRSGQFTVDEDEQIRRNVQDFISTFGIESGEMLFHPYLYPEMKKTVQRLKKRFRFRTRLVEGLHRFTFHVYIRAVKLFVPQTIRGRFSSEEEMQLKMYCEEFGKDWQKIACAMNREYSSIRMKVTQFREGNRGDWSAEETNRLIAAVKDFVVSTLCNENNGEEPVTVPKRKLYTGIPWFKVEERVETRVWTTCRTRWFHLIMMRMNNYVHPFGATLRIKAFIKTILWLHDQKVRDYGDIKWGDLCDHIGNVPIHYMQRQFHVLKQRVDGWKNMRLYEIVSHLYHTTLPNLVQTASATDGDIEVCTFG
ncbi:LOW QUALITY PROTEIN: transcription termination factor 1 [Anomaloglossus baeobatrachus]|uniref:LOW QUALITY PROTEIN: transcription termination factor 1 n=1 Tax=Anomaloglossus baeobatrachus TaxID=238106 RepID=UPI003F4FE979